MRLGSATRIADISPGFAPLKLEYSISALANRSLVALAFILELPDSRLPVVPYTKLIVYMDPVVKPSFLLFGIPEGHFPTSVSELVKLSALLGVN